MLKASVSFIILILLSGATLAGAQTFEDIKITHHQSTLSLIVDTDKQTYHLREKVSIHGNLTLDGQPRSGLVAIEVNDPDGIDYPIAFRTVPAGNPPDPGIIEVLNIIPCDYYGEPKETFKINEDAYVRMSLKYTGTVSRQVAVAFTFYDGNMIPLGARKQIKGTMDPEDIWDFRSDAVRIPSWADTSSDAEVIVNVYSDWPSNGGVPYRLEESSSFQITLNGAASLGTQAHERTSSINIRELEEGVFNATFRLSPEPKNGTYTIHATAMSDQLQAQESTTFYVEDIPCPPQASFIYSPSEPGVNMSINFDASSSSAEGYGDTITSYEWDFGDGNKDTGKKTTHQYTEIKTYIVTLNVTDAEGLWCTTSKPVTTRILGPTADFSWTPSQPSVNYTVTFDASASTLGWNGTHHPPIVSYEWDFGDGNTTTVATPTIDHTYTAEENYTVTLVVTDSGGLQDNKTQNVTVISAPPLIGDVNGDGWVDMTDIGLACLAYGSEPGDPDWDPRCDMPPKDDFIDMTDIGIICLHYGEHT